MRAVEEAVCENGLKYVLFNFGVVQIYIAATIACAIILVIVVLSIVHLWHREKARQAVPARSVGECHFKVLYILYSCLASFFCTLNPPSSRHPAIEGHLL